MARIRLNADFRTKIGNRGRLHFEQVHTQEKEKYLRYKEDIIPASKKIWADTVMPIVRRSYPTKDVEQLQYYKNKYGSAVDCVAPDSCFYFAHHEEVKEKDFDDENEYDNDTKETKRHFDFKIDGSLIGREHRSDHDFAYAMYRDELKAQDKCNPDINIEQGDNSSNPHWTMAKEANARFLGLTGGSDNATSYTREWNDQYKADIIGTSYCRSRSIACNKAEFDKMIAYFQMRGQLVNAHQAWIKCVLNQVKEFKLGLKSYKYLDEAIELANECGLSMTDDEIIRANSTGLIIYNPKNLADRIKGMANTHKTREQKIAERHMYIAQNKGVDSLQN